MHPGVLVIVSLEFEACLFFGICYLELLCFIFMLIDGVKIISSNILPDKKKLLTLHL